MTSLDKIKNFCGEKGLIYSVAIAERLDFEIKKLEDTPFVNFTVEERLNPRLTMEKVKTIIFLGVPYKKNKLNHFNTDYHIKVNNFLEELKIMIGGECESFVDTGALFERGFSIKSGLGFKGRNTSVISEKLGSYFNIGYILTTEAIPPTNELSINCISCDKCLKHCPTQSLYLEESKYYCNYQTCISYLTQKKGVLLKEEMKSMGTSIYGCEICQQVCPHNRDIEFSKTAKEVTAFEILKATKKGFLEYKDLPFYWRGLPTLKRNALISVYNGDISKNEKLEIFKEFKKSENLILSETAKILIEML